MSSSGIVAFILILVIVCIAAWIFAFCKQDEAATQQSIEPSTNDPATTTAWIFGGGYASYGTGYRIVFSPSDKTLVIGPQANLANDLKSIFSNNKLFGIVGNVGSPSTKIVIQVFNKAAKELGNELYLDNNYQFNQMALSNERVMALRNPATEGCQTADFLSLIDLDSKETKDFLSCRDSTECLVSAQNGDIYRLGGTAASAEKILDSEKFDAGTGEFVEISILPAAALGTYGCIGVEHEGSIVVCSDGDLDYTNCSIYHPDTNAWGNLGSMVKGRMAYGLASVGGELYAIGGKNDQTAIIEHYNENKKQWEAFPVEHNLEEDIYSFAVFSL